MFSDVTMFTILIITYRTESSDINGAPFPLYQWCRAWFRPSKVDTGSWYANSIQWTDSLTIYGWLIGRWIVSVKQALDWSLKPLSFVICTVYHLLTHILPVYLSISLMHNHSYLSLSLESNKIKQLRSSCVSISLILSSVH